MITRSQRRRAPGPAVAIAFLLAAMSACDKHPTAPSAPPHTSAPQQPAATPTKLTITSGPALTGPHQTSQFVATLTYSDGQTKDVTQGVQWQSSDQHVATVSYTGIVTAVDLGDVWINASYSQIYASLRVFVLPAGTFIVSGNVNEPVNLPIASAGVAIVDGPSAGRSTMTDQYGHYKLVGLSGNLTIQASRDGYVSAAKTVAVSDQQTLNFDLQPTISPGAVAGQYRLTVTASSACHIQDDLKTRTYAAQIDQMGAAVTVTLSGANFFKDPYAGTGNRFSGRIAANVLALVLGYDDYYGIYDLVEQTGPTTYLAINGSATATISQPPISAGLTGTITVYDAPSGFSGYGRRTVSACTASDHSMVFSPLDAQPTRMRRR
jgi:hypothetical protein